MTYENPNPGADKRKRGGDPLCPDIRQYRENILSIAISSAWDGKWQGGERLPSVFENGLLPFLSSFSSSGWQTVNGSREAAQVSLESARRALAAMMADLCAAIGALESSIAAMPEPEVAR